MTKIFFFLFCLLACGLSALAADERFECTGQGGTLKLHVWEGRQRVAVQEIAPCQKPEGVCEGSWTMYSDPQLNTTDEFGYKTRSGHKILLIQKRYQQPVMAYFGSATEPLINYVCRQTN